MKICCLLHVDPKKPLSLSRWIISRGHELTTCNFLNENSPPPLNEFDFIIVLGGYISVTDSRLEEEKIFLKKAAALDIAIVGICLGAQLLCGAFGAHSITCAKEEVGLGIVTLTDEAKSDPVVSVLPSAFEVFHYHSDMPGLSQGASVLAKSVDCPHQIIRFSQLAYGLQFHLEVDCSLAQLMVSSGGSSLELAKEYLERVDFLRLNELLFQFLDRLVGRYLDMKTRVHSTRNQM